VVQDTIAYVNPHLMGRKGYIALAIIVIVGIAVYVMAGGLMDWLRVTLHGR
jgi:hypothetical protein